MAAADGTFNSTIENVVATVNTTGLSGGRHIVFVRGKDAANNWGAFSAAFLEVTAFSATPASQTVCTPNNALYNISVGYAGQVTFNVTGNPAGATTTFLVNPVAGPGNTVLTIGNTGAAIPGAYSMTLTGAYTGGSQNTPLQLIVSNAAPGSVTLTARPTADRRLGHADVHLDPVSQAASYSIQVATSPSFANIVASASGLTATSFTPAGAFNTSTTYSWRVWADNACGAGAYSAVYSFAPGSTRRLRPRPAAQHRPTEGFESGANGWTLGAGSTGNTWALWTTNLHSGSYAITLPARVVERPRLVSRRSSCQQPVAGDPQVLELPGLEAAPAAATMPAFWSVAPTAARPGPRSDPGSDRPVQRPYRLPVTPLPASTVGAATRRTGSIASWTSTPTPARRSGSASGLAPTARSSREGWSIDDVVVQLLPGDLHRQRQRHRRR